MSQYNTLMQKAGKRINQKIYYFLDEKKVELTKDQIKKAKPFFSVSLTGTTLKCLEFEISDILSVEFVYFENTVSYGEQSATKNYGRYKIIKKEYNADLKTYTYTACSNFINAMIDYEPIKIEYPTTILNFFKQLCIECGYETNITSLPNGDKILNNDIYENIGFTYRDVYDDIGQATASLFNENNNVVERCLIGKEEVIIDDDILKNQNITLGEHFGPINSIILSRSGDSDKIYKRDESLTSWNEFEIKDNQLMNDNNRDEFLEELYNALYGIEFDLYDLELVGFGGFEPLQKIKIVTDGKEFSSYIFSNEEEYTQGYKEVIYNELPSESNTDYSAADKTDKKVNQAYIIVKKQEKKIEALTSEITETSEKVTKVEQSFEGVKSSVTNVEKGLADTNTNLQNTDKKVKGLEDNLNGLSTNFNDFKDNEYVKDKQYLQDQIDGAIQFWNGSEIPTLNNKPASDWKTEADKNNHRADLYTVIDDSSKPPKQGKTYRFDKVNGVWQWIELTDNELSAVQALAQQALDKSNQNADDIGVLNKKASEFEQTDEQIKASVEELDNQYKKDMTLENTVYGNPAYIENASDNALVENVIYGATEQETRSGKNFLYHADEGAKWWRWNNGAGGSATLETFENGVHITVSSLSTSWQYTSLAIREQDINRLKPNNKYTLSFDYKTNSITTAIHISIRTGNSLNELTNDVRTSIINDNEWHKSAIVLTTNDLTATKSNQVIYIVGFNNLGDIYIKNIQLEEGIEATDFEPYGVMPSPEYPSEVKNVEPIQIEGKDGYWLKGKITGKNLIYYPETTSMTSSISGITFKYDKELDEFSYDGTAQSTSVFLNLRYKPINFDKLKKYTMKITNPIDFTVSITELNVETNGYITPGNTKVQLQKLDTSNPNAIMVYSTTLVVGQHYSGNFKLMVHEGTDDIPYEQAKEKEFLYDMNKYDEEGNIVGYHELSKINDTKDEYDVASGVLTKRIGKVIFDGSNDESISLAGTAAQSVKRFYLKTAQKVKKGADIICNRLTKSYNYNKELEAIDCENNRLTITLNKTRLISEDVQGLREYLNNNPLEICYELETPYSIQLEPIEVKTFDGVNNIYVEDKYNLVDENKIVYLTDSFLNTKYASKAELKVASDSIKESINSTLERDYTSKTEFNVTKDLIESLRNKVYDLTNYIKMITASDVLKLDNTFDSNGAINYLKITNFSSYKKLYPGQQHPSKYTYPGLKSEYTLIFADRQDAPLNKKEITFISPVELNGNSTISDEVVIQDNKIKIIQKVDNTGKALSSPIEYDALYSDSSSILTTFDNNTFIMLKDEANVKFECEYLMKNELTNRFATTMELMAQQILTEEMWKSTIKKGELSTEIQQTAEIIKFTNGKLIIDMDNFKLDPDGNVTLANGAKIIGGYGLLTFMTIPSTILSTEFVGGHMMLPLSPRASLEFQFSIPKNFKVEKAYIVLNHAPTKTGYYNGGMTPTYYNGYCRHLKLYRASNISNLLFEWIVGGNTTPKYENTNYTEIPNAFGADGFTGSSSGNTKVTSIDVKDFINTSNEEDTFNIFTIKTSDTVPEDYTEELKETGICLADLTIVGYMSFDK